MSVTSKIGSLGWVVSHAHLLDSVYSEAGLGSKSFFEVDTPFRMDLEAEKVARSREQQQPDQVRKPPKKKRKTAEHADGFAKEREAIKSFLISARPSFDAVAPPTAQVIRDNNRKVRDLVKQVAAVLDQDDCHDDEMKAGSNDSDRVNLSGSVVLPPRCRYFRGDVFEAAGEIEDERFDVIVIDPPWENKHVRRTKAYGVLSDDDVGRLPVGKLLSPKGNILRLSTVSVPKDELKFLHHYHMLNRSTHGTWSMTGSEL